MTTETQPRAEWVDESGWLVKGWGHTEAELREAVDRCDEGELIDYDDPNPVDSYERREIWVRKFNQPKGADYSWYMQEAEPHARGAGRFTFIDFNQPLATVSPRGTRNG